MEHRHPLGRHPRLVSPLSNAPLAEETARRPYDPAPDDSDATMMLWHCSCAAFRCIVLATYPDAARQLAHKFIQNKEWATTVLLSDWRVRNLGLADFPRVVTEI
jgi:hypothetical protein